MDALPEFELVRPKTLDALLAARAAHPRSNLLGGGTDLIVNIRRGIVAPKVLTAVNGIDELAGITSFLISSAARNITGQTIVVDGGWTAQ